MTKALLVVGVAYTSLSTLVLFFATDPVTVFTFRWCGFVGNGAEILAAAFYWQPKPPQLVQKALVRFVQILARSPVAAPP